MTQFYEGQEVEVFKRLDQYPNAKKWRKARITYRGAPNTYEVVFPHGTRAVFDADQIRKSPQEMAQAFYDNPPSKSSK